MEQIGKEKITYSKDLKEREYKIEKCEEFLEKNRYHPSERLIKTYIASLIENNEEFKADQIKKNIIEFFPEMRYIFRELEL